MKDNKVLMLVETHCICGENFKDKVLENRDLVIQNLKVTLDLIDKDLNSEPWEVSKVLELRDRISMVRLDTAIDEYKVLEDKLMAHVKNKAFPL